MPSWFHHFKHHVVLNVLNEVEHPLSQSEGASKPERAQGPLARRLRRHRHTRRLVSPTSVRPGGSEQIAPNLTGLMLADRPPASLYQQPRDRASVHCGGQGPVPQRETRHGLRSYRGLGHAASLKAEEGEPCLERGRGASRTDAPLCGVQRVLLGGLVADPDAAELALHVLAVEHVPEEHLVARQGFPARRKVHRTLTTPGGRCGPQTSRGSPHTAAEASTAPTLFCTLASRQPGNPPWTEVDVDSYLERPAERIQSCLPGKPGSVSTAASAGRINAHLLIISDRGHLTT